MFAHLQVHMQMENHYSSAHKGATYKEDYKMPISNKIYPRTGDIQTVYLKNVITNPNIMLMYGKEASNRKQ